MKLEPLGQFAQHFAFGFQKTMEKQFRVHMNVRDNIVEIYGPRASVAQAQAQVEKVTAALQVFKVLFSEHLFGFACL